MKITLLAAFILFAATALGQVSSEPQIFLVPDHPRHAAQPYVAMGVCPFGGGGLPHLTWPRPPPAPGCSPETQHFCRKERLKVPGTPLRVLRLTDRPDHRHQPSE